MNQFLSIRSIFKFSLLFICLFSTFQTIQAQAPSLTSFSPASGPVGSSVVLTGTNFSATAASNIVYFGAVKAAVTAASANSLTVTVPAGASYKPITVAVAGNLSMAISATPFVTSFTGGGAINSGSFSSTAVILLYSSFATKGIAAGDIDGDGKVDLLSANNATTNFSLFRNTSTPGALSFATAANTTWPGNPNKIRVADLNADGKMEIMGVSSNVSNFTFWQNSSTPGSISLSARLNLAVSGTSLNSLAMADFDNDGKIDGVVLGNGSNSLNIVKNNTVVASIIGMQTTVGDVYTTGTNSIDVSTADFNLDGKQDIIVTGWGAPTSVAVYPNTSTLGSISFGAKISLTITGATNPSNIAIGDLDGDGKMDLVISDRVNGPVVSVYRNTSALAGAISFAARQAIAGVQFQAQAVDLGDLDGDGKIDLVMATSGGIDVLKNTSTVGAISFGTGVKFSSALGFEEVVIGDFDGDGRNEFAGTSNSAVGAIYVFRNIMAPPAISSFSPERAVAGTTITITGQNFLGTTAVSFGGVAAASFIVVNSTTITAVVGSGASGNVSVTNAFGTGTAAGFTYSLPPTISNFTPASGAVGTVVTVTGTDFGATPAENIVFFGATKATVTAASLTSLTVTVPSGATYERLSVLVTPLKLTAYAAKPFLVTYAASTTNFTAQSFATKTEITGGNNMYQTVLMDMDNDGKADMLASSGPENSFATHRNTSTIGNISFAARTTYATVPSGQPFGIAAGDLNADGKPDVVVANATTGQLSVASNTTTAPGSITYGTRLDFMVSATASPRAVNIVDLDNDGKPEMVSANAGINSFSVFRNTTIVAAAISFAPIVSFATGSTPVAITAADFDGDGKVDIAVTCFGSNTLNLFRNTSVVGSISFAAPVVISASGASAITVGDLNADNQPDLLVSNGSQISVIQNASTTGNLSFFAIATLSKAVSGAAISDLNGDGKPDIAAAGASFMAAYANESLPADDISFAANRDFTALSSAYSITTGDIDGDGKNDVVVTNRALTGIISVFRNTNSAPMPPTVLSFTPKTAPAGTTITITGNNFTGTNGVTFGGIIASSFLVVNANTISAVVNSPGFSGDVEVTNTLGSAALPGFTFINYLFDVQSCGGSPIFITSNVTGLNYQWQVDDGSGFVNISAANADYAGVNTVTLTIPDAPSTWYGYKYRCLIGASPSNVFVLKFVAQWIGYYTGTSDIEWENTANWNCGKIPDANTDVIIVGGPVTINSAAECRTLTSKQGATVTVTTGNSLNVVK